jgi:hypothetical protein
MNGNFANADRQDQICAFKPASHAVESVFAGMKFLCPFDTNP